MPWSVEFLVSAALDLKRIESLDRAAVESKIAALSRDVPNLDVKRLAGPEKLWRLRVGRYRVVFRRDLPRRTILVLAIAHRKEAYR